MVVNPGKETEAERFKTMSLVTRAVSGRAMAETALWCYHALSHRPHGRACLTLHRPAPALCSGPGGDIPSGPLPRCIPSPDGLPLQPLAAMSMSSPPTQVPSTPSGSFRQDRQLGAIPAHCLGRPHGGHPPSCYPGRWGLALSTSPPRPQPPCCDELITQHAELLINCQPHTGSCSKTHI